MLMGCRIVLGGRTGSRTASSRREEIRRNPLRDTGGEVYQGALALTQQSTEFEPAFPFIPPYSSPWHVPNVGEGEPPVQHHSDHCFRELLDALPAAVYTTDAAGRITFYNEAAAELWAHRPELGKSEWCGSWQLLWPDGTPMRHDECPMAMTLREGRSVAGEAIAVRPDGTQIAFAAYPKPLRDVSGRLVGAVNTLVDITHRKAHEEHQRLLIHELNHRVKNTLATVQSIAAQSFRGVARDHVKWFEGRLVALSKAHDVLTDENWQGAGIHEFLARVTAPLIGLQHHRFETSGPEIRLSPRMVLSLSMALHELCTNAAKYGALSNPDGRVRVAWSMTGLDGSSRLHLRWEEQGGPPVSPPRRNGFGSRLITRGVAHELGAQVRLEYPVTGVTCEIDAPLA
jgi:PAS domain S-box-containing protein